LQRSERGNPGVESPYAPKLDLSPPVCLDAWAVCFVAGLLTTTVVPMFVPALVLAVFVIVLGAGIWRSLVPERWRLMALISPLFLLAGVGAAALHSASPDPLGELASLEPGEVYVAGRVASPPEPSGIGYGSDLLVDSLSYEGNEVVTGGKLRLQAPNLGVGAGDEVRVRGEISEPEPYDNFDYGRYLRTVSSLVNAGSRPSTPLTSTASSG
jgi:hypothetical protein